MTANTATSAMETAEKFFHACEGLEGWAGCEQHVADGAPFDCQSAALAGVDTVEGYCNWMAATGSGPLAGCSYELHTSAYDEATATATFFATFHATHESDGGPMPPTGKTTASHYVYVVNMNDAGQVGSMTKIWNDAYALSELGWA